MVIDEASATELAVSSKLLAAIGVVQKLFLVDELPRAAFQHVLDTLIELSGSEYGFVAEVHRDPDGAPFLRAYAMTDIAWNEQTRAYYRQFAERGLEFRNLKTLFGHAMLGGQVFITNDAPNHPHAAGVPHGHPPLNSFMALPIMLGDKMVGMAGLANRPGGFDVALAASLAPLLDSVAGMLFAIAQQHSRKLVEQKREQERILRSRIVEYALDFVLCIDDDGKVLECSPSLARALRRERQDIIGSSSIEVVLSRPADLDLLRNAVADEQSRPAAMGGNLASIQLRSSDAVVFPVEASVVEVMMSARLTLVALMRDVSERERNQRDLQRARELAELASESKSAFVEFISHELRIPLTSIVTGIDLLDRGEGQLDREAGRSIQSACDSLLELIDEVLDLSKVESGRIQLAQRSFSVDSLVTSVVDTLQPQCSIKGIKLRTTMSPDSMQQVVGDPVRLRQALLNIAGNAVKFTESGLVEVACVAKPSGQGMLRIEFAVRDTGIGMTLEAQSRIMGRFSQADDTIRSRFGGSGLGLYLSRELIRMMNGDVRIESIAGQGSSISFSVDLPVSMATVEPARPVMESIQVAAPAVRKTGTALHTTRPLRILLVDDDERNRRMVGALVRRFGHDCEVAGHGGQALEMLVGTTFDVVLLDLMLPDMSGYEVAAKLRRAEVADRGRRTSIIALSGLTLRDVAAAAKKSGIDGFIAKPFRSEHLFNELERLPRITESESR